MIWGGENVSAIYNGDRGKNNVAITFNVYENTEIVEKILDKLKEEGKKATFFVGGVWADDNASTLIRILEEGHELGNHGYFHKDHKKLNYEQNKSEIQSNHLIVKSFTGYEMTLFAPPSGSCSKTTLEVCSSLNYKTIMWSKDTIDWRDSDINLIVKRATKNVIGGDIILMHPKSHTLSALDQIIKIYEEKKLQLVTVSECCGFNLV
jgi:peptidoglycan/xylan/chitin deacetylase (PgdA/CDA1 family)